VWASEVARRLDVLSATFDRVFHDVRKKGLALSGVVVGERRPRAGTRLLLGYSFVMTTIALRPIGKVESRLTDLADAPRQADEGAPDACLGD
jgi:hypothetical protein